MSSDFKNWWDDYGSGLIRHTNHDHEQHAERVAAHAWEHRDYREAMLRGEIATHKIENANLRAEVAALRADLIVTKARVAAMQRDLAGKTRERDKARRESCVLESMLRFSKTHPKETVSKVAILRLAQEIAVEMEWDCFPEEEER